MGFGELTSISAYRYNKFTRGQDADFNNLDILFRNDDGSAFNYFKTFTQEVRLQGRSGRLDWLVGGYYANEKLRVRDNLAYGEDYPRYVNCVAALNPASGLGFALDPASPQCLNPAALAGAQAQLAAGIGQVQAGIAALQAAIANPATPPEAIPGLQAQLAGLQTQLTTLVAQATSLGIINANPANPGFGSIANVLGLAGDNPFASVGLNDLYNQTSNNFALFTHNIFAVTDQIDFTVGARYTHEKKRLRADLRGDNPFCSAIAASPLAGFQTLPCVLPGLPGGSFVDRDSKTENKLSGTVVLSYKPTSDLLTYASYSRGYKAGGYNLDRQSLPRSGATQNGAVLPTATFDDLEFDPEIVDAVELGAKYNGRGFDVNVAAFQQLFDDFQLNLFNGISFEVENVNSCSKDLDGADSDSSRDTGACDGKLRSGVRSRGVELEVFARPFQDLSVNFGTTYANTRYRKNLVGADGDATSPQLFQLPGRRISNSAAWTSTGAVTWTPPIGGSGLNGLVYFDARYMSDYNTGSDLDIEKVQDGYTVVNGRVGIHGPNDQWAVELWARNLFDKDYVQVAFDAPLQGSGTTRGVEQGFYPRSTQLFGAFLAEPRTFGVTLRARMAPAPSAPPVYVEPPAPPPPAMQTCPGGTMIPMGAACPVAPMAPMAPPPPGERG
jgi:outer membrane receptor protein involved in Fe transport